MREKLTPGVRHQHKANQHFISTSAAVTHLLKNGILFNKTKNVRHIDRMLPEVGLEPLDYENMVSGAGSAWVRGLRTKTQWPAWAKGVLQIKAQFSRLIAFTLLCKSHIRKWEKLSTMLWLQHN